MVAQTLEDAIAKQKEPFTIDANWEPMVYDKSFFPAFDETSQDIVTLYTSFNETLFGAFY
jgi:hypothetical protein